ncbi:MAG: tetratricopeptide repeat protein, partial [Chloroflexi bacterium]|nr:tetratricopeptide repeat protein [Chloroflexota bacterium]
MADINAQLQQAYALIKAGQKQEAAALLVPLIRTNPSNVDAWWLLANAVDDENQMGAALEQMLKLRPDDARARRKLARLNRGMTGPLTSPQSLQPLDQPEPPIESPRPRPAAPPASPATDPSPTQAARRRRPEPEPEPEPIAEDDEFLRMFDEDVAAQAQAQPQRRGRRGRRQAEAAAPADAPLVEEEGIDALYDAVAEPEAQPQRRRGGGLRLVLLLLLIVIVGGGGVWLYLNGFFPGLQPPNPITAVVSTATPESVDSMTAGTEEPTPDPAGDVTAEPTEEQVMVPTADVTAAPTEEQVMVPTADVTAEPTDPVTADTPTDAPKEDVTAAPTDRPTA